jgi:hypothetical protein
MEILLESVMKTILFACIPGFIIATLFVSVPYIVTILLSGLIHQSYAFSMFLIYLFFAIYKAWRLGWLCNRNRPRDV